MRRGMIRLDRLGVGGVKWSWAGKRMAWMYDTYDYYDRGLLVL